MCKSTSYNIIFIELSITWVLFNWGRLLGTVHLSDTTCSSFYVDFPFHNNIIRNMIWFAPLLHETASFTGWSVGEKHGVMKAFNSISFSCDIFTILSFVSKWCWLIIQFLIMCSFTVPSFHWLLVDQLLNTRRKVVNFCKRIFERKLFSRTMPLLMLFSGIRYFFFQFNSDSLYLHCFMTLIQLGWRWSFPCFTSCGRY